MAKHDELQALKHERQLVYVKHAYFRYVYVKNVYVKHVYVKYVVFFIVKINFYILIVQQMNLKAFFVLIIKISLGIIFFYFICILFEFDIPQW
jgi:hypothetical protein